MASRTKRVLVNISQEENGTFNGGIGDIIYRRADFTVNGFFIKDYLTRELEFSAPSYNDKLCIIVRSADRVRTAARDADGPEDDATWLAN